MTSYQEFKNSHMGRAVDVDGGFGAQCLAEGSLVTALSGELVPIEMLVPGDVLKGGNTVITNYPKESKLIRVETDLGIMEVTPDHRFILEDGTERRAEELSLEDEIKIDREEPEKKYHLTDDELRFLGFYLADGTKKYRWENSAIPEAFVTAGADAKIEYLENLDIEFKQRIHSNKKAKLFVLVNKKHPNLVQVIHQISNKELPEVFTKEQYALIIEGYSKGDGCQKGDSCVITSVNKALLTSVQFGCVLNGWRAKISKPIVRESTNICDHPKPIYHLTINKKHEPKGKVKSIEKVSKGTVYILNTDGNHLYYAANHQHHNCWDLYAEYCRYLGYPYANCNTSGYVKDIWNNRHSNGILNNFTEVLTMQAGDVAIFKEVAGITPWSHVAIFDHDAGGGYGWFFGQNQGAPGGAANLVKLPYSATFDTAFRPKCFMKSKDIKKEAERSVYRLYNPNNGDHLFTANYSEANHLYKNGWNYDGLAWKAPEKGDDVYRLSSSGKGFKHYTANKGEKDALVKAGWKLDGIAFKSGGGKGIYRLTDNRGHHMFTASKKEHDDLTKAGWTCEGFGMYGE